MDEDEEDADSILSVTVQGPKLKYNVKNGLGEFFFNLADRFEDHVCQTDATTEENETYGSVKRRSIRVAMSLEGRGISDKDFVVFCCDLSLDSFIPMLASLFIGAKIANLSSSFSLEYAAKLLDLVAPTLIFVTCDNLPYIEQCINQSNIKADIIVLGESPKYSTFNDHTIPNEDEAGFTPFRARLQDVAVVFFSKETEEHSLRAVSHSHFSFLNAVHSFYQMGFLGDITLSSLPFSDFFTLLLITSLFLTGGQRIFCKNEAPGDTFRIIQDYRVTHLFLRSEYALSLTECPSAEEFDISSLVYILLTGSPLSFEQIESLNTLFKEIQVIFAYGQKEVGVITMFNIKTDHDLISVKPNSSGKAAAGMAIQIVDEHTSTAVGPNQNGEICVKSPSVLKGYYKEECSTLFDSNGYLKTGDNGCYDVDECFYVKMVFSLE